MSFSFLDVQNNRIHDDKYDQYDSILILNILSDYSFLNQNHKKSIDTANGSVGFDMSNIWLMKEDPTCSLSNLRIDNESTSINELNKLTYDKKRIFIDLSNDCLKRNILGLKHISEAFKGKMNLLFSTGPLKKQVGSSTTVENDLKHMKEELLVGISLDNDNCYIKPSFIRCCVGPPLLIDDDFKLSENDKNEIISCALVHDSLKDSTNIPPLVISMPPLSKIQLYVEVMELLKKHGAVTKKIILNQISIPSYMVEEWINFLTVYDCILCFDTFGFSSIFTPTSGKMYPNDDELTLAVTKLLNTFSDRVVLSLNIFSKIQLSTYGGYGYDYLDRVILNRLEAVLSNMCGKNQQEINNILKAVLRDNLWGLICWRTEVFAPLPDPDMGKCYLCDKTFILSEDNHFSKFQFDYCSVTCLSNHRKQNFVPKH